MNLLEELIQLHREVESILGVEPGTIFARHRKGVDLSKTYKQVVILDFFEEIKMEWTTVVYAIWCDDKLYIFGFEQNRGGLSWDQYRKNIIRSTRQMREAHGPVLSV